MTHVVFTHGFLGSSLNWSPIQSKLSMPLGVMGVSCQFVDLLWHAKRPGPSVPGSWNLETLAADFLSQVSVAPGTEVIGVGHSFGLRPLLAAAKLRPNLFSGLIIEDSSPQISDRGYALLAKVFSEVAVPFASRDEAKKFLDQKFGPQSQMARFLLSNLGPQKDGTQNWRFQKGALEKLLSDSFSNPLWSEWESFSGPIHLILGGESDFVSSERLEKCLTLGKNFGRSFEKVAGAGHWVHADQPDIFCDLVQRKIEEWLI